MDTARIKASNLYDAANEILNKCSSGNKRGGEFSTNGTFHSIRQDLSNIDGSMTSILDLTDCSTISPIFRQLLFGSTCTESVKGLAALYSILILITLFSFVILSTRAALYNPVIRGRRNKRREKEFDDYKVYMSEFYNTTEWDINRIPEVCTSKSSFDESDGNHIDAYNSDATYNIETNRIDCESAAEKNSTLVRGNNEEASVTNTVAVDDDDDSYDSTYSIDAGEEQSVSSSSVFSIFMKKRVQTLHQNESNKMSEGAESQDEIISKLSSGSSLINRFRRRNGKTYGNNSLSLHPMNTTPHHPYDHRVNSYDEDDDDVSVENDENDSNIGVLLTPPMVRYAKNLNHSVSSSQRKHSLLQQTRSSGDMDEMSTSPLALELQPLSPASIKSENIGQEPDRSFFRGDKFSPKEKTRGSRWTAFR